MTDLETLANDVAQVLLFARVIRYPTGWGLMSLPEKLGYLASELGNLEQGLLTQEDSL